MTIHHTRPIQKRMTIFAAVGMKLSLLETNLGMPYIYLIYLAYSRRFRENSRRREVPVSLTDRIRENNTERVKEPTAYAE